jgi:hypothetical protein
MITRLAAKAVPAAGLASLLLVGLVSCARPTPDNSNHAGQSGPDYELDVAFRQNVSKSAVSALVTRCTGSNPVVIRTAAPSPTRGNRQQYATTVFASSATNKHAKQLVACFRSDKIVASAGWPA